MPSVTLSRARLVAAACVAVVLTLLLGLAVIDHSRGHPRITSPHSSPVVGSHRQTPRTSASPTTATDPALARDLAVLRDFTPPSPGITPTSIGGVAATQPDLYAAEFTRRLLTQNYSEPRIYELRWVAAESAQTAEPLVVGLVPPALRGRLGTYSVTAATPDDNPIPGDTTWERLGKQHATSTVTIQRVTEPLAWTQAVADGRITDPSVTAREVMATVTRHIGGHTTAYSIDLAMNLEGPPARKTWGFVMLVTYTSIPLGPS